MSQDERPLVSVLTPVYNGEAFLAECIESVLSQTYDNYEYIIVNNCSTDRTLGIAEAYARKDKRIRIHNNTQFVGVIDNHNIAFKLMSDGAKYCKIVSADDFIFPHCISQMVECAETNPSVGIVGSYQLSGSYVRWQGFEYPKAVFTGNEVCRRIFLTNDISFGFGSPSSLMYRADIVRASEGFYPNQSPHSDTSACFRDLQRCDFGFVYEILAYEKTHAETQSSKSADLNRYSSAYLNDLIQYGSAYLNSAELEKLVASELEAYHRFLAVNYFIGSRNREFWDYHKTRLSELGHPLSVVTLLKVALRSILREIVNPALVIQKLWGHIRSKMARQKGRGKQAKRERYGASGV